MGNKPPSSCRRQKRTATTTATATGKWSNTPHDILVKIANRINSIDDYVSFRRVCSSWRSAATKDIFNQSPTIKLPWLMLMLENKNNSKKDLRQFFSLANGKLVHKTILPKTRPPYSTYFESQGWLFNHETTPNTCTYLTHLISGVRFDLPTVIDNNDIYRRYLQQNCITKVVLSTHNVTSPNFLIVIATYDGLLCWWRPGAVVWTKFEHPFKHCREVAYNRDKLYVIDGHTVARCKIEGSRLVVSEQVDVTVLNVGALYLVEPLDTELDSLLVVSDKRSYSRPIFYVFEVDLRNGTFKEVNNLGDGVIFCGTKGFTKYHIKNASMLAKSLYIRGVWPANCVYVMDSLKSFNDKLGGIDLYYYNLEERSYNSCKGGILSHIQHIDRLLFVTPKFS